MKDTARRSSYIYVPYGAPKGREKNDDVGVITLHAHVTTSRAPVIHFTSVLAIFNALVITSRAQVIGLPFTARDTFTCARLTFQNVNRIIK